MDDDAYEAPGGPASAQPGHGEAVWERVRRDYGSGLSASMVCERHGVSRSALYERARREGWRRMDELEDAPAEATEDTISFSDPPIDPRRAADAAWRQVSYALQLGRLGEAAAWTRLCRYYRQIAREDEARAREAEEAAETARRAAAAMLERQAALAARQDKGKLAAIQRGEHDAGQAAGLLDRMLSRLESENLARDRLSRRSQPAGPDSPD